MTDTRLQVRQVVINLRRNCIGIMKPTFYSQNVRFDSAAFVEDPEYVEVQSLLLDKK